MGVIAAHSAPFTPRKFKGHIRSASDPVPSTSAATSPSCFSFTAFDDGLDERTDNPTSTVSFDSSRDVSPSAATSAASQLHHTHSPLRILAGKVPAAIETKLRALGPRRVAYEMPNIKASHQKLRYAQCLYPPEMCVFVGNLPAVWDDGMLTRAVKYEFGHFGPCNVGIFRKVVSKPYAIVQYTDMNDAAHAVFYGNGLWMERRLRVEWSARARR